MSTIDGIAAYVKCWHNAIEQAKSSKDKRASFMLSNGKRLDFIVREEYLGEGGQLKGSVIDLEAAYKQCPIHPQDHKNSVLVMKDPESNEPAFFIATALPFGASGSVHGFNRLAAAINFMAHKECGLPVCNYFDDYTLILPKAVALEGDEFFREMLGCLGWPIKPSEESPMQDTFKVLGVMVDLKEVMTNKGELVVTNTEERAKELKAVIQKIFEEGSLSAAEASQLRGRLGFANSQTFGREGAYAYLALGRRVAEGGSRANLSRDLRVSLRWWLLHFDSAKPRKVRLSRGQTPVFLFTDGACEDQGGQYPEADIGGVLYDPVDGFVDAFGDKLPPAILAKLSPGGVKRQVVGQAELFPCWAARVLWQDRLQGRPVVHFVDNESAKFALIKGTTGERTSAWICQQYWRKEVELESFSWLERVPSASNCADGPSRGATRALEFFKGGVEVKPVPPDLFERFIAEWERLPN